MTTDDALADPSAATSEARWRIATVVERDAEMVYVSLDGRVHEARRALGCIVVPEPGDRVALLVPAAGDRLHVMQVLERTGAAALVWAAAVPVTVEAPGITLRAGATLAVHAERLEGRVSEVAWWSRIARLTGVEFIATTRLARWVSESIEQVTGQLRVSAQRSYRNVAQAEHIRTGLLDIKATTAVQVQSENVLIRGKNLAKIDAAQIHFG